ncbi:Glycosyl transferase family 2 [Flavobacterium fluvii]|uniref:Glycosyl transferase family 2 n=1 Tax=Flavobacterium fluvii TaxID=468056 RepID=A0A1M5J5U8_9FLAO|nr:glycosyltransferase family A protein [Flavobacterium fluvii]SHG35881.1 Glycosyl transferase family 2 [Flavobacterium fluvii]
MAFFSIIIPLYNKEKYIENALKSILKQTVTDYEIIIVDDGSTDKSREIASKYVSNKIRIIDHFENKGLSAARNTGIKNAKSNYVTFLDADDLWHSNYLQTIKNLISSYPEAHIFATNFDEVYPQKTHKPHNGSETLPPGFSGLIDFFKINLKQGIYTPSSSCWHKSVFETAGYYDEKITFSEDLDFNIRANLKFKLAYSTSAQMSYFMETDNQITRSSILSKTVPDYDQFEKYCSTVPHLKKYLDFERYVLSKHLKVDGDKTKHKKIIAGIDFKNLNYKQRFLLNSPVFLLRCIKTTKDFLIRKGFKWTSY